MIILITANIYRAYMPPLHGLRPMPYQMFSASFAIRVIIIPFYRRGYWTLHNCQHKQSAMTQTFISLFLDAPVLTMPSVVPRRPEAIVAGPSLCFRFHHPFYVTWIRTFQFCALALGWEILLTDLKDKYQLGLWILTSVLNKIICVWCNPLVVKV